MPVICYLKVKCLGCNTHQTVALNIVRRLKAVPILELERYMRCRDCSQVRGYPYKRSHLVALRTSKITATVRRRLGGRGNDEDTQSRWGHHSMNDSFAEYAPEPNPETKKKDVVWFASNGDRPLTAFAGIWTEFTGDRGTKSKPAPGPHLVYGFLTTAPNAVVKLIHAKAMPLILTTDGGARRLDARAMG